MVCSPHHIHCSDGADKASRKWVCGADLSAAASGVANHSRRGGTWMLGLFLDVADANILPSPLDLLMSDTRRRGAPLAPQRQSGRAGRDLASGRNVGQVCANGAATKLHRWFSWAALTKCRCSEIVLGDPNTRYEKLLTRLTGPKKTRKWPITRASCGWRDPAVAAGVCHLGAKTWG